MWFFGAPIHPPLAVKRSLFGLICDREASRLQYYCLLPRGSRAGELIDGQAEIH